MQITKPNASDSELFQHVKKLQDNKMIVGGALYRLGGEKVGAFGKMPELGIENLKTAGMTFLLNRDGSYYDIAFSPVELQRDYRLILRHDSSSVKQRLLAFFFANCWAGGDHFHSSYSGHLAHPAMDRGKSYPETET